MFIQLLGLCLAIAGMVECRLPSLAAQADVLVTSGSYEKAIELYSIVLAFAPEQAEIWFSRGQAYGRLGQRDAKLQDMARWLKLIPLGAELRLYFAFFLEDTDGKLALLKSVVTDYPQCSAALTAYGGALAKSGQYTEAKRYLDLSIRLQPRNNDAYFYRSCVLITEYQFEQAEKDLAKAEAWHPGKESTVSIRKLIEKRKNDYQATLAKERATAPQRDKTFWERNKDAWDKIIENNKNAQLPHDVIQFDSRDISIPITLTEAVKQDAKSLLLYTSTDQGKSWLKVASARPNDTDFQYQAPSEGLYWFSVQYATYLGKLVPENLSDLKPHVKININTKNAPNRQPPGQEDRKEKSLDLPESMKPPQPPKK